ncbi:hypothetical protein OH710_24515 [Pseudomonas capsici]|uniref:hypothetical protein n=1 Tax=Pseudomonas capsici TaxID=2810614 RepID=UPI0021F12B8A|nr:hypothetical protein [Pseudomonas capsici]MCV4275811.1 hypothetical protein [Pseudomonas capsici]
MARIDHPSAKGGTGSNPALKAGFFIAGLGVRRNMIIFGVLSTFQVIPLLTAIRAVQNPYSAFALVVAALYTPVTGVLKADF